jgi:hypothetical protein
MADDKSKRWRLRDAIKPPFTLDLVWAIVPFAIALICFGLLPLRSWDYWWHVSIGRLIDYVGAVPAANHYLYTMEPDAASFIQPWMSQWLLHQLDQLGGLQLVLIVRNVVTALGFGALGVWAMRRTRSAMIGALLTCAGLALAFPYIGARTHLFVWPLFIALLGLGDAIRHRKAPVWLIGVFPLAAALWANMHGSFFNVAAICLAFGAAALLDKKLSPERFSPRRAIGWLGAVAASAAAPLINPRGAEIYGYVATMLSNDEIHSTITEWMPTSFSNPEGIGVLFYVVLVGVAYVFWRRRKSLDAADVLLIGGFGLMAVLSARSLLWFGPVLPVALAPYLGDLIGDSDKDRPPLLLQLVHLLLALGLITAGALSQPGMSVRHAVVTEVQPVPVRARAPMAGLVSADTPLEHVEMLRVYRSGMRVFHSYKYGGYLMYHLAKTKPYPLVFVDQRIELPSPDVWRLYETVNQTPAWRGIFQQFGVDAAVLNVEEQSALIERMRDANEWSIGFEDDHNVLFLRKE